MSVRPDKRLRRTGRSTSGRFIALPDNMTSSDAWGALSGNAVKLIVEIARQFDGKNNGDLSAPWSKMKRRGFRSKSTLYEATKEASDAGFIIATRLGGRHRLCTLYAITWKPVDDCKGKHGHPTESVASNLWKTEIALAMRTSEFAMRTSEPEIEKKAA